jgi:hypothetical protein
MIGQKYEPSGKYSFDMGIHHTYQEAKEQLNIMLKLFSNSNRKIFLISEYPPKPHGVLRIFAKCGCIL